MADGEAVFLHSKRCLIHKRLQSANNKCQPQWLSNVPILC